MKKEKKENYLSHKPLRKEGLAWEKDEEGKVTLLVENKGFFNRLFQILFKKPRISQIHLDEMGSFLWPLLDGKEDLVFLGEKVKEHFGEKAEPLYPRLSKYVSILASYGFVTLN